MEYFLIYLALINLVAILLCADDKRRAIHHKWRIHEATLMLIAALGGSIGMLFAMKAFRHKTRHKKFTLGIPLILIVQLAVAFYIYMAY